MEQEGVMSENKLCPCCGKQPVVELLDVFENNVERWFECVTPECPLCGIVFTKESWNDRFDGSK